MIHEILAAVSSFVLSVISAWSYLGVFLLMTLESANIPIPSEIIMPFSGFLVARGVMNLWAVIFWGALGNLAGSLISYGIAFWLGNRAKSILSRLLFIDIENMDKAEVWFKKYGNISAFFARFLPIFRTFISFPAGMFRAPLFIFLVYTFVGSFFWSAVLAYAGYILGENWETLVGYFREFDYLIAIAVVLGIAWWLYRHLRRRKNTTGN